jgi:uncharacterized C2H2 Zn-finger protein
MGGEIIKYKCNKCGREFQRKSSRTRHQNKCGDIYIHMGYECFIDQGGNEVFVHRHIMEQKLGRKLKLGEEVHHKDEDKLNNDPDNLELTNKSDHTTHHWNHNSGEKRLKMSKSKTDNWQNINTLKLTPEKVIEIRKRLDNKEKQKDLASEYGVSHYTIMDIRYRKTWKHI